MAEDNTTQTPEPEKATYFIYDPFAEVDYPFTSLDAAKTKADDLGASRIRHEPTDGSRSFINKVDGKWPAENAEADKQVSKPDQVLNDTARVNSDGTQVAERDAKDVEGAKAKAKEMSSQTTFSRSDDDRSSLVVEPGADLKLAPDDKFARPRGFDERFVVTQRGNTQELYRGYDDKTPAIQDQGDSLKTKNADRATAMDMVELAAHRGWSRMNVKGPEDFRREMWIEGTAQGIDVRGYRPNDKDKAEADRRAELVGYRVIERADGLEQSATQGKEAASPTNARSLPSDSNVVEIPNYDKGVTGKITDIGTAPYRDREKAAETPYVAMQLPDGRSHKLWGVGLPDMVNDNNLKVGDTATIASAGTKPVTVEKTDPKTGEVKQIDTFRREWDARDIQRQQNERVEPVTRRDEAQQPLAGNPPVNGDGVKKAGDKDRADAVADRLQSPEAARDPQLSGAKSKLAIMEAELQAQGVDKKDINTALANARTEMGKTIATGQKITKEKLPNVTAAQQQRAAQITTAERTKTLEKDEAQDRGGR
ncbi:LPD7 domain-containing protein [Roseobacter weihaiensis]|uniref:LPD7 domain-containing protein n=1 Tax=Roseobacter weihaiensis TaxID=2763262 RepID=UPI001D0B5DDA|nr:LPD7 domain-containing protein [Roseobacter sp. H9]